MPDPGRPTSLTPDVREKILMALGLGNYRKDAAEFAGIDPRSLQRWLARGKRDPEGEYGEFAREVAAAESRAKIAAMGCVNKAARDGDWRAATWMLERKWPAQFSDRSQLFLINKTMEQIELAAEDAGVPLPEGVWQTAWTSLARDFALKLPSAAGIEGALGASDIEEELADVEVTEEEKTLLLKVLRQGRRASSHAPRTIDATPESP